MYLETLEIDLTESLITQLNWSLLSLPKCELGQNLSELKSSIVSGLSSASSSVSLELKDNLMTVVPDSIVSNNMHLTTPN